MNIEIYTIYGCAFFTFLFSSFSGFSKEIFQIVLSFNNESTKEENEDLEKLMKYMFAQFDFTVIK